MKGGNCCKFETKQGFCPTDGIFHEKKNTVTYCDLIGDVYVFYIFHAFKHMDELDMDGDKISCYDLDNFRKFIIKNLPTSSVFAVKPRQNPGDARTLHTPSLLSSPFGYGEVSQLENGLYVSLCLDNLNKDGHCVFFVFEKEDESITIITLGNCQIDFRQDEIAYIPVFYNNTNDDDVPPLTNVTQLNTFPSMDKKRFISDQKPTKSSVKLGRVRSDSNSPEDPLRSVRSDSNSPEDPRISVRSDSNSPEDPLISKNPTEVSISEDANLEDSDSEDSDSEDTMFLKDKDTMFLKASKKTQKKHDNKQGKETASAKTRHNKEEKESASKTRHNKEEKESAAKTKKMSQRTIIENMGTAITINNISLIPLVKEIISESSRPGRFTILFDACVFDDAEIVLPNRVQEIVLFNCNEFPNFKETDKETKTNTIFSIFVVNCNAIDFGRVAHIRSLYYLDITRVRQPIVLLEKHNINASSVSFTECQIENFYDVAPKWRGLTELRLEYTNIRELPPLQIKSLTINTETREEIDIKHIKKLEECQIRNNDREFRNDTCWIKINEEFRRQLVRTNLELSMEQTKIVDKKFFDNIHSRDAEQYAGMSKYIFSPNLMWNTFTRKFACPNFKIFNCEKYHLFSKEELFKIRTKKLIEEFKKLK